jgi:hypothetical protein
LSVPGSQTLLDRKRGDVVDRRTRLALMTEALGALAGSHRDGDFMVFDDLETKDYVQFMLVPFLGPGDEPGPRHSRLPLTANESVPKAQMEVTDRGLHTKSPPPGMPPLSPLQVAAIQDCGFALGDHPNYMAFINLEHVAAIAEECEYLFTILGSASSFELGVTNGLS